MPCTTNAVVPLTRLSLIYTDVEQLAVLVTAARELLYKTNLYMWLLL
jgi:hypothetical protein